MLTFLFRGKKFFRSHDLVNEIGNKDLTPKPEPAHDKHRAVGLNCEFCGVPVEQCPVLSKKC